MKLNLTLPTAMLALALGVAHAAPHRSHGERSAFVRANPCPATNEPRLPCPGYIIDHVVALCAGGADKRWNMQWQTVVAAKEKDRWECPKRGKPPRLAPGQ